MTIEDEIAQKRSELREAGKQVDHWRNVQKNLRDYISVLLKAQFAEKHGLKVGDVIYVYESKRYFIGLPEVMYSEHQIIIRPQKGRRYCYEGPWGLSPKPRPPIVVDDDK